MSLERDNIRDMTGYTPGEQPEDPGTIKLNTNENPYPPTPRIAELLQGLDANELRRYPPATALQLRRKLAELHGVTPEQVIATRGGDELLRLAITTFADSGEPIGMTEPTYTLYSVLAHIHDSPIARVPMNPDWSLPDNFAEEMNHCAARLAFIVNPHAPSGVLAPVAKVRELAERTKGVMLIDEAYIDFAEAGSSAIELTRDLNNVLVLRTLSKGYSLAGARIGYGIGSEELIHPMLTKTRDSYNMDLISQRIAEAAIDDQDYARGTWQSVITERERLRAALGDMGYSSPVSSANFLLISVGQPGDGQAEALSQHLREHNILVRHFMNNGLADKLRISVGTPAENNLLLAAMQTFRS